MKSSRNAA